MEKLAVVKLAVVKLSVEKRRVEKPKASSTMNVVPMTAVLCGADDGRALVGVPDGS